MYEYKCQCIDCGAEFLSLRKWPLSPSEQPPKRCKQCLGQFRKEVWRYSQKRRKEDYYIDKHGYANIRINGQFVAEHRFVMEQTLGRSLKKGESVHHKDGDRAKNYPDNLELWVKPQQLAGQRASDLICPHCGKSYLSPG